MSKPTLLFRGPIKTISGYGAHSRDLLESLYQMDLFDIKRYQSPTLETEDPILWTDQHCRRVLRGGSCWYLADDCRVSVRFSMESHQKLSIMGLRLVRSE